MLGFSSFYDEIWCNLEFSDSCQDLLNRIISFLQWDIPELSKMKEHIADALKAYPKHFVKRFSTILTNTGWSESHVSSFLSTLRQKGNSYEKTRPQKKSNYQNLFSGVLELLERNTSHIVRREQGVCKSRRAVVGSAPLEILYAGAAPGPNGYIVLIGGNLEFGLRTWVRYYTIVGMVLGGKPPPDAARYLVFSFLPDIAHHVVAGPMSQHKRALSSLELVPLADIPIDNEEMSAQVLTLILFMLGHEAGHIEAGHTDDLRRFIGPAKIPNSSLSQRACHRMELEADLFGLEVLCSMGMPRHLIAKVPLEVFCMLYAYERSLTPEQRQKRRRYYPSPFRRLRNCLNALHATTYRSNDKELPFPTSEQGVLILKEIGKEITLSRKFEKAIRNSSIDPAYLWLKVGMRPEEET